MRLNRYSPRTEQAYVDWIKRFIRFHGVRHTQEMGADEVKAFLSHVATQLNVAASTQNQAFSALLFLYQEVLKVRLPWIHEVVRARRPGKLPAVFSQAEARAVLARMHGTPRLMAHLLYGSGLRVMECVRLRVKDIDLGYLRITIRTPMRRIGFEIHHLRRTSPLIESSTAARGRLLFHQTNSFCRHSSSRDQALSSTERRKDRRSGLAAVCGRRVNSR